MKIRQSFFMLAIMLLACFPIGLYCQSEPGTILDFPRFNTSTGIGSGIAIFNPASADASVSLALTGLDGVLLGTHVTVTVPALGQIALTQEELFGSGSVKASLRVTSSTAGIVAVVETFDSNGTFMDGTEAGKAALQLVFPVIPGTAPDRTQISLLNRNTRDALVRLKLQNLDGRVLGESVASVPAFGALQNSLQSLFPAVSDFSSASHILATSTSKNLFFAPQTVSGTSLFSGTPSVSSTSDIAALNALLLTESSMSGAIPFFQSGPVFPSILSIVNIESAPANVSLTAIADNGSVLGTTKITVPANGGTRQATDVLFPQLSSTDARGWFLLQSSGRIMAANLFGQQETGAFSAIPMQNLPRLSFAFPQIVQGFGFFTELSLANPGPDISKSDLFLISPNGTTTSSTAITLPPGGHISSKLSELFPQVPVIGGGVLYVRSSTPIFGTISLWSTSGKTVASFGPQAVPVSYAPGPVTGIVVPGTELQLSGVKSSRDIIEGSPAATITLDGSGFLEGAAVKINGSSDGISVNRPSDTQIIALVPATYFEQAGVFPVTVQNPLPAAGESNVQFLTVYFPRPALESIDPEFVSERLEDSSGPVTLHVSGYGFRRGAVVLFENNPVPTSYCEDTPACLTEELTATIDPGLLRSSGFRKISVKNPDPSVSPSQIIMLRVESLQPTIASVLPGSATVLDLPCTVIFDEEGNPIECILYELPLVIFGTNFDPKVEILTSIPSDDGVFSPANEVISSNQLVFKIEIKSNPLPIGTWAVWVKNPQPGGGVSEPAYFTITQGSFVANPFITSIAPDEVTAGGQLFTLTVNGTNFKPGCQINFYSNPLPTTFVDSTQVTAQVPAALIKTPGKKPITVTNPDNGGTSNKWFIEVE